MEVCRLWFSNLRSRSMDLLHPHALDGASNQVSLNHRKPDNLMLLRVKHYGLLITAKRLRMWSIWDGKKYPMSFEITRWNPLTYLYPISMLLARKFSPRWYLKNHKEVWDMCHICHEKVATETIGETLPSCKVCKQKYD